MGSLSARARCLVLALAALAGACASGHDTRRLADGTVVHTFRREFANVHAVVRDGHAFLMDSGYERNAPRLAEDLADEGIDPARLGAIVVSHGHADHAGGAGWFQRRYHTRIVVGQGDTGMTTAGRNERLCPTSDRARGRLDQDQNETYTPFTPDLVVDDELDLAALTGVRARAVRLPGHTEGSLVVMVSDAALVGDLFRGSILGHSATVHFFMCDLADNRRDVQALLQTLAPTAGTMFTGHFGPIDRASVVSDLLEDPAAYR